MQRIKDSLSVIKGFVTAKNGWGLNRVTLARMIAVGADALQLGLFPLFAPGVISPLNIAVDVLVCLILTRLVGWHFVFLPSFLVEGMPLVDMAPTWTIAVLIATRTSRPPVIDVNTERTTVSR